jgi:hypothetical protein
MREINREYLVARLKGLSEWADYVHLSLTIDQPHERGMIRLLESAVSEEDLHQLRFDVRSVWYRLSNLSVNLSATSSASPVPTLPAPVAESPVLSDDAARVP